MTTFEKSVSIIVPSKTMTGDNLNLDDIVPIYLTKMTLLYGGATANAKHLGAFLMSNQSIMIEEGVLITSFTSNLKLVELHSLLLEMKNDLQQETVAYIINNSEMGFK